MVGSTSPRIGAPRISLGAALSGHNNALGLLRLIFASAVIFAHAFPLGGFGAEPLEVFSNRQTGLGNIAVLGFFAISGFVITMSGLRSDILQFMWSRVLRIFPAFWVVLIFAAFCVGPIVWLIDGGGLDSYFNGQGNGVGPSPYAYILDNAALAIRHFGIYDIFHATPYGAEMNASLWTLIYEWECYLVIGVLIVTGVLRWAKIVIPLVTTFFLTGCILNIVAPGFLLAVLPDLLANTRFLGFGWIFFLGATLAVFSHKIPFNGRWAVVSLVIVIATLAFGSFDFIGVPAFCYLVLFLGAWLPSRVRWIGQKNDYSYGVYIYGFLVQQALAYAHVNDLGYWPYAIASWVVSFGFAWLSWHLIEKRFMALKNWGPGKGISYWLAQRATRMRDTVR